MTSRKAILISNPKTGRYTSRRLPAIEDICSLLSSQGLHVELVETKGPGDATRLAVEAGRKGFSDVLVAGGDGTINEALQGLVGTSARLGILPRGTANVLACELGLPLECHAAADVIAQRSEEHTSELQSLAYLVCRLLLEKKK